MIDKLLLEKISLRGMGRSLGISFSWIKSYVKWMVQIIKRNQLIGLEVLQKTYEHLGVIPKRNLLIIEKFNEYLANVEDLIIDWGGVEQHTSSNTPQSNRFVVLVMTVIKKMIILAGVVPPQKSHTVKTLLIINQEKKIEYLSHCYCGAMHDYRILKEHFSPQTNWRWCGTTHVDQHSSV
jgi:hypothetical protein